MGIKFRFVSAFLVSTTFAFAGADVRLTGSWKGLEQDFTATGKVLGEYSNETGRGDWFLKLRGEGLASEYDRDQTATYDRYRQLAADSYKANLLKTSDGKYIWRETLDFESGGKRVSQVDDYEVAFISGDWAEVGKGTAFELELTANGLKAWNASHTRVLQGLAEGLRKRIKNEFGLGSSGPELETQTPAKSVRIEGNLKAVKLTADDSSSTLKSYVYY